MSGLKRSLPGSRQQNLLLEYFAGSFLPSLVSTRHHPEQWTGLPFPPHLLDCGTRRCLLIGEVDVAPVLSFWMVESGYGRGTGREMAVVFLLGVSYLEFGNNTNWEK